MWDYNDPYDVGCSSNNKRWTFLNAITKVLYEEKIELDELMNDKNIDLDQLMHEVQEPSSIPGNTTTGDHSNNPLVLGFLVKGKRSSRKKSDLNLLLQESEVPVDRPTLKLTFKSLGKGPLVLCPNHHHDRSASTQKIPRISSAVEDLKKFNHNPQRKRPYDQKEEDDDHKRVMKKNKVAKLPQALDPVLPQDFKNHITNNGGCLESARFIIQKELFQTDVSKGHNRLSIPYSKIVNEFLTPSQIDGLSCGTISEIRATLVQPCLEECEISLRDWKSNGMYALVSTWYEVCKKNDLRQGVIVQLWSFRRNSELCFALVRIN